MFICRNREKLLYYRSVYIYTSNNSKTVFIWYNFICFSNWFFLFISKFVKITSYWENGLLFNLRSIICA